ncbi:MAG: hypothetical protein AB8G22_12520 [Saprospiraceae bacterium]
MKNIFHSLILAFLTIGLMSCADETQNESVVNIESDGEGKLSIDINTDK